MSEYPSTEDFMAAHIQALEAELHFFRSVFPRAAQNYQKMLAAQHSLHSDAAPLEAPDDMTGALDDSIIGSLP